MNTRKGSHKILILLPVVAVILPLVIHFSHTFKQSLNKQTLNQMQTLAQSGVNTEALNKILLNT